MDWLLEHEGDQDIDTPLTPDDLQSISKVQASIVPDAMSIQRLKDMGFGDADISNALRMTSNNYEAAAAWLLGDRDMSDQDEEEVSLDGNPLLQSILNHPDIQNALDNPRVMQALKQLLEDPSSASQYMNDPEVGPVLQQVKNIIQQNNE